MKKALFGFLFLMLAIPSFAATFDTCDCEVEYNDDDNVYTSYIVARKFLNEDSSKVSVQLEKMSKTSRYADVHPNLTANAVLNICKEKLTDHVNSETCPSTKTRAMPAKQQLTMFDICECETAYSDDSNVVTSYIAGRSFVKDNNGKVSVQLEKMGITSLYTSGYPTKVTRIALENCQEKLHNYVHKNACPPILKVNN